MSLSLKVIVSPEAEDDLRGIAYYTLAEWGEPQSHRFIGEIYRALEHLGRYPALGKVCDDVLPGGRCHPVKQYNVYYRVDQSAVEIVRILHARMSGEGHLG